MWFINIQITCSSETRNHVDIKVQSTCNIALGIYMHVVRINRLLNYETLGLYHKYTRIWYAHSFT